MVIEWNYIPYNFRQKDRIGALKVKLKKLHIPFEEVIKQDGSIKLYGDKLKDIKAAYRSIPGGFNSNSMTLFSGVSISYIKRCYCNGFTDNWREFHLDYRRIYLSGPINCLYTGDYDASRDEMFDELKGMYSKYWESIECIQIPHHGSKDNYNIKLIRQGKFYIISVGCKNKYKHLDSQVIKDICLVGAIPLIVTEETLGRVFFCLAFNIL